jgi:hypothetical protein
MTCTPTQALIQEIIPNLTGLIYDNPFRPLTRNMVPVEYFRMCITFNAQGAELGLKLDLRRPYSFWS